MNFVDVIFPASGELIPADHGYTLYTALTRVVPEFHRDGFPLSFAWINGLHADKGVIRLFERSSLRCRVPAEQIAALLPLTGETLQVAEHPVRLGIPRVAPLSASPSLVAKMVTFKHAMQPEHFLGTAREKLRLLNISDEAEVGIPLVASRERKGEPRRRILRVRGRQVVGFSLLVAGLTAAESLRLQESGLGGRRRMGCGFFLPWKGGA
jgi:CRISPR-associated protein Cas6